MDFIYVGGTPQQKDWAKAAIAFCEYPFQYINVNVYIQWVSALPASDTNHPYMETVQNTDGSLTILIPSWADDPTNPNLQGLPNPQANVKEFYIESLIHEFGHVVSYCTFADTAAPQKLQKMCSLFWTSVVDSGSGVRYGSVADFASNTAPWANLIKEAVAEVFKCAFYSGVPLYFNRTNWNISKESWADFLTLFAVTDVLSAVSVNFGGLTDQDVNNGPIGLTAPIGLHGNRAIRSASTSPSGFDGTYTSGFRGGALAFGTPASPASLATDVSATADAIVIQPDGSYQLASYGVDDDQFSEADITATVVAEHDHAGLSATFPIGQVDGMSGAISASVAVVPGSQSFFRYDITFRWDVVGKDGNPTGDFLAVTFAISYNLPTAFTPTREVYVNARSNGVLSSFHYAKFLPSSGAPGSSQDAITALASPVFTTIPVSAPYPFHEGSIDIGSGLRGAIAIG